jgi:hypothetical protein
MYTKILNDKEVKEFTNITDIKATKVLISKNKKYYYATIVDESLKIRISEELAKIFL